MEVARTSGLQSLISCWPLVDLCRILVGGSLLVPCSLSETSCGKCFSLLCCLVRVVRDSSACSVKNYTQSWQLLCPEALSKLRRSVTATWCSALCGEAWTCRADSFFLHAMPEPTRRVPSHVCKAEDSIKSINATASVKIAAAGPNLEFLMMLFFPSVRVISFEAIACLHLIMVD